jgi:ketosteroid isomerase-like protein
MKGDIKMKNLILLLSIILIFTSCEMKQNIPTQQEVEQTILAKERQWLDSWAEGDPLVFLEYFADDLSYFDDIAVQTRIDSIKEMQNYLNSLIGKIPPHSYEIVDPRVQVYGDVAIVTLQYHSRIDGEPNPPWKATDVYHLSNNEWKIVHAHWSLVKEE